MKYPTLKKVMDILEQAHFVQPTDVLILPYNPHRPWTSPETMEVHWPEDATPGQVRIFEASLEQCASIQWKQTYVERQRDEDAAVGIANRAALPASHIVSLYDVLP